MRTWKGKLVTMLATVGLVLLVVATPAMAYTYPSTNALNAAQQTPGYVGLLTPYVHQVGVGPGSVTLEFVGGYVGGAWFEYRLDGAVKTSGTAHPVVSGDFIYPNIGVAANTKLTKTFSAGATVEIRLALGAERDWDFDWTTFQVGPGSLVHTTGTWAQYPVGAPVYQAQVQQPINTANTSNWSSKSKGGIPVMFKLLEKPGPAAFESIGSDGYDGYLAGNFANDLAYMSFTPVALTFADIGLLKTDYAFTLGNCHGGSLRWQVRTSPTQALFIYYGDEPNTTDCTTNSQSGVNMIGFSDLRYDTSQYPGGTFYDTYAHALTLMGSTPVVRVSLVIDSGWQGLSAGTDQRLNVSNTTVNDSVYQWNATGDFAPTCDLPDAFIDVTGIDTTPTGAVNESTVYPASTTDTSDQFRVIDCKYQYVLSIPSLHGIGTYQVAVTFDGTTDVPTVAQFDLK